ncbi:cuticle protein 16.8-like [Dermacentor albipictus]|uniref:cuticle protein 16.8-like n=1 Tax=Dermacentor albipictus TaxID=60249 RepID=UPI0031FCB3E8
MIGKVFLLACLAVYAAGQTVVQQVESPPQPYSFRYDTTDEYGTRMTREETSDEYNNKVGSYSYTDPNGITRTAHYVADADGFRVAIETNEPGTRTSNPADAQITSSAVEPPPTYAQATPVPYHAPVAVHAVHAGPDAVATADAVHAAPVAGVALHAVHVPPDAVHASPVTLHAAPVSYATANHAAPLSVVGRAKSRR